MNFINTKTKEHTPVDMDKVKFFSHDKLMNSRIRGHFIRFTFEHKGFIDWNFYGEKSYRLSINCFNTIKKRFSNELEYEDDLK